MLMTLTGISLSRLQLNGYALQDKRVAFLYINLHVGANRPMLKGDRYQPYRCCLAKEKARQSFLEYYCRHPQ